MISLPPCGEDSFRPRGRIAYQGGVRPRERVLVEQKGFISVARRWWLLLVVATLIGGVTAGLVASSLEPAYESEVRLLTGPISADFATVRASGGLARTYAEIATSQPLLQEVSDALELKLSPDDLTAAVTASSNEVSRIVTLRIRQPDANRAATFANELARRLTLLTTKVPTDQTELIDELLRQREITRLDNLDEDRVRIAATRVLGQPTSGRLEVIDPARPALQPVAPRVSLIALLGALGGLFVAWVIALVRDRPTEAVDDEQELADLVDVPVLGALDGNRWPRRAEHLVIEKSPKSRAATSYRLLADRIGTLDGESAGRTVLVVASEEGDASGTLAANLAAALSEAASTVTIVDANGRDTQVTRLFGLADHPGLAEMLQATSPSEAAIPDLAPFRVRRSVGLEVVPAGRNGGRNLVGPQSVNRLLEILEGESDLVVVTAPPVGRSPDTLVWAREADATILVVGRGTTPAPSVTRAVKSLTEAGAQVAGTVLYTTRRIPLLP